MMAVWGEGEGAWVDRELGRGRRSASASSEIFALYKVKHHKVRYAFLHILFALIFPNKNIKKERKGKLEKFRSGFVPLRSLGCCQGFAFVRVSFATIKLFNRNLFESPKVTRTWRPKKKREWPAKKVEWKRRLGKTKFVVGLIVVFIVANAAAATASLWYLLYYVQVLFSKWNEFQVHSAAAAVDVRLVLEVGVPATLAPATPAAAQPPTLPSCCCYCCFGFVVLSILMEKFRSWRRFSKWYFKSFRKNKKTTKKKCQKSEMK